MNSVRGQSVASRPTPRRRWLRRLIGLAIAAVLGIVVAFGTLPWWLPTGWLRGAIAGQLARLANRPVDVGAITLGWGRGVEIRGIRIADGQTRGGCLIELDAVRCGLTPLRWIRGGGLDRLELIKPTVHVQIGPDGRLNLAGFSAPPPGKPLTHRWVIRDGTVHVARSETGAEPVVRIGDIEVTADPVSGAVKVAVLNGQLLRDVHMKRPDGAWAAQANLRATAARRATGETPATATTAEVPFHGDASFTWHDVDLSSLPVAWWPGLRDLVLKGRCSATIRAGIDDDLRHTFELSVDAHGLTAQRDGRPSNPIEHAALRARGVWRPTEDAVTLDSWRVELPGIELEGVNAAAGTQAAPLEIALRAEVPLALHARGRVADLSRVRQWSHDTAADEHLELAGGCDFNLDWVVGRKTQRIEWRAKSRGVSMRDPEWIDVPRGCPLEASITAVVDAPRGRVKLERGRMRLGGLTGMFTADVPLPVSSAAATGPTDATDGWRNARLHVDFEASRCEELLERLPGVKRALASAGGSPPRARGKAGGRVDYDGATGGARLAASLWADQDAEWIIGEHFAKRAGRRLTLDASAQAAAAGMLRSVDVALRYGDASLRLLPAESNLRWAVTTADGPPGRADGGMAVDGSLRTAWQATGLRNLLSLVPDVTRQLAEANPDDAALDGCAAGRLDGNLRGIVRDGQIWPQLARVSAGVDAFDTQVMIADAVRKPAGFPAQATVEYWFDAEAARHAHRLEASLKLDGGETVLAARIGGGYVDYEARATIDDVDRFLAHSPRLFSALRAYETHGGATAAITASLHPDEERFVLDVDASAAEVNVPPTDSQSQGPAFHKAPGVPMRLRVGLAGPPAATEAGAAPGEARWLIGPLNGELAASNWELGGDIALAAEPGPQGWARRMRRPLDVLATRALREMHLNGRVLLASGEDFASLGACPRRLAERYELDGSALLNFDMHVDPAKARLTGALDASNLTARRPGVIRKRAPIACNAEWDVALENWARLLPARDSTAATATGATRLDVRELKLSALGVEVEARGGGLLTRRDGSWGVDPSEPVHVQAAWRVDDVTTLAEAMESGGVRPRSGGARGRVEMTREANEWRLIEAQGRFDALRSMRAAGARAAEDDLYLDGSVVVTPRAARSDGLSLRCGRSDVTLVADVHGVGTDLSTGIAGTLTCGARRMDFAELPEIAARWKAALGIVDKPDDVAKAGTQSISPERRAFAAASDFHADIHLRDCFIPHLAGAGPFETKELTMSPELVAGALRLPFECAVNGGVVTGRIETVLDEANPYFDLSYEARKLTSEPNTRPLVEAFFPGLGVTGAITLIDATHQRLFDRPGVPNAAVGTGEMILEGGAVAGRSAPLAITAIFPGLNLTRFEFTRMVNRFEKTRDGNMHNHMTFLGTYYDMYVDGTSFANGQIRYEVGIDLYASLLPNLSRQGQGRIAIFIKTARKGPNNTLLDETVWYLRPDQILAKILSDNLLTQTYHTVKGSLGKRAAVGEK